MTTGVCMFKPVCPTTNYWVKEKKGYIETVCNTANHKQCITYHDFIGQDLTSESPEWKKIVKYFEKRKKKYPPYGLFKISAKKVKP